VITGSRSLIQVGALEALAAARKERLDRLRALAQQPGRLRHGVAIEVAEHERGPLGGGHRAQRLKRPLAGLARVLDDQLRLELLGLPRRRERTLDALLPTIVVKQLVPRDPMDPPRRRRHPPVLRQLGDSGEERLLGQILGHRHRPAAAM
jgi:hypothetical protein